MDKLTKTQQEVFNRMVVGKWYSAYDLKASLATLNALNKKKLVLRASGHGYLFSPRTSIEFKRIK